MPSETQIDFSGGLNTRHPAHRIGANQVTELQNADLSFGDLRGEFGAKAGAQTAFFYEAGDSWVSSSGFSGDSTILSWPYGTSYSGSTTVSISADVSYFSGSPIAEIKEGVTITIADDVTVTIYDATQGIHGANSFVEYNDDLFIGRSTFDITVESTANSKTLTTENDTNKLQIGDELVNSDYVNDGVYITSIDSSAGTVTINDPATASTSSAQTFSVRSIISKFIDGDTSTSFRVGVNKPKAVISFSQTLNAQNTVRDSKHSDAWFSSTDPIPFQYGISAYDSTGVESTMGTMTDSNVGSIGGSKFDTSNVNTPQTLTVDGVDRYSNTDTNAGRFALYRVGGTSAVTKRLDNLYLDSLLNIVTDEVDDPDGNTDHDIQIKLTQARNNYQYKVKWYSYDQAYKYSNSGSGYNDPYDGTSTSLTGETDYLNPSTNSLTFQLTGSGATHKADFFVFMKFPGETVEREYVCRVLNHDNADVSNANSLDYLDFQRADGLVDVQPIEEDATPVRELEGLIESSNLFYAFKNNRLYISDYGNPNSWPASGYLDFDQNITGLGKLGSELVVFSEYGMYRVFGSDPSLLKKVQIPTTEGVKSGANKTIVPFQNGLIFAGLNGICFYNGQAVSRVTQNILDAFALPNSTASNNHGGYFEDTYYLLGSSGTGYKVDLKTGAKLSRTTMTAGNLFYRGSDNILYSDTGKIGDPTGARSNFTVTTRKFDAGDINEEKIYYSVKLTGENFDGTMNVLVDGTQTDTFSVPLEVGQGVADLDRTFYLASPRQGNGIQVQLSDCSGQINRIVVNFDSYASLSDALFDSVTIKYIGTPTVAVDIDGTNKITATALSAPTGAVGEGKLYFPAMSNGIVPHLRETNNESSGRVLSHQFSATPV